MGSSFFIIKIVIGNEKTERLILEKKIFFSKHTSTPTAFTNYQIDSSLAANRDSPSAVHESCRTFITRVNHHSSSSHCRLLSLFPLPAQRSSGCSQELHQIPDSNYSNDRYDSDSIPPSFNFI